MAAARTAFRVTMSPLTRPAFRPASFRQPVLRQVRRQTTAAGEGAQSEQSTFSKFLNSKVGPKTVHFWAPIMKVSRNHAVAPILRKPVHIPPVADCAIALVGSCCCWSFRPTQTAGVAQSAAEPGPHGHGLHLDPVVLHNKAPESIVRPP